MTAASTVRCDYCHTTVPADQAFTPVRGGVYSRCKDEQACNRRQSRAYDPTIPPDEDLPVPPPGGAPAGAACANCGATGAGLYAPGNGAWMCRDRAGCEQRGVEFQYLTAWTDSSPGRLIAQSGGHLRIPAAAPPQVLAEQTALSPAEMAELAQREGLGRKRVVR